ncbi:hypothetical protein KHC28_02245 [Ancylobacter sonchi]|uniref:hypothetical protein n=1 Tax=Ancylobacter sonchi TaxID=1937790 RepID=UPI001BD58BAF|nr:hypothetical protein [Ancylobacter sonchi]MBS7532474.1 hypothetical protein [Ancylobacter sonchi]
MLTDDGAYVLLEEGETGLVSVAMHNETGGRPASTGDAAFSGSALASHEDERHGVLR